MPPCPIARAPFRPPPALSLIVNLIEVRLIARTRIKERDRGIPMFANGNNARGLHRETRAHGLIQRIELENHLFYRTISWRPNGSRLSCGRRAHGRKAVEPQIKRLASEATQFLPTCERPPASSAC